MSCQQATKGIFIAGVKRFLRLIERVAETLETAAQVGSVVPKHLEDHFRIRRGHAGGTAKAGTGEVIQRSEVAAVFGDLGFEQERQQVRKIAGGGKDAVVDARIDHDFPGAE